MRNLRYHSTIKSPVFIVLSILDRKWCLLLCRSKYDFKKTATKFGAPYANYWNISQQNVHVVFVDSGKETYAYLHCSDIYIQLSPSAVEFQTCVDAIGIGHLFAVSVVRSEAIFRCSRRNDLRWIECSIWWCRRTTCIVQTDWHLMKHCTNKKIRTQTEWRAHKLFIRCNLYIGLEQHFRNISLWKLYRQIGTKSKLKSLKSKWWWKFTMSFPMLKIDTNSFESVTETQPKEKNENVHTDTHTYARTDAYTHIYV